MGTRFEKYFQPTTVKECCELLREYGKDAKVLAGGTDLVARLKSGAWKPFAVIGMRDIPDMNQVFLTDDGLNLGAMAQLWDIERCQKLAEDFQVIRESCGHVSSIQVRSIATIGGNACNASPSADAIHGLLLMDTAVNISSADSSRQVLLGDFFTGPGKTVLERGELLVSFFVPKPAPHTGCCYQKYTMRGDSDISIIGAGARITLDEQKRVADCRITLASVAPIPMRALDAEQLLLGQRLTKEKMEQAAKAAADAAKPISDNRATAKYRKEMVQVWTLHALEGAFERAEQN